MPTVVLQTHDLAVGYTAPRKPDVVIAADINLSLHRGELVCLLGPNGGGKSTLLRTLSRMQKPLNGRIMLTGEEVAEEVATLKPRELATRLSVVLTDRPNVGLLNGYALVALGRHPYTDWTGRLSDYDEAVVRWAVDAVDARALAERPVMELSDGQRQKLMIARALAQESEIILLDEPTAFLDMPRRAEIMHLLKHLAAQTDRAILLSTHDLDLALRSADTLWLMSGGKITVGTPEDLVLSGTFEDAFRSEGVRFDRATGAFKMHSQPGQTVIVQGQGIPHTWTRRALQRIGFTVEMTDPLTAPLAEIRLSGDEDTPIWHLQCAGQQMTYHTIQDLLSAVRQLQSNGEILHE